MNPGGYGFGDEEEGDGVKRMPNESAS